MVSFYSFDNAPNNRRQNPSTSPTAYAKQKVARRLGTFCSVSLIFEPFFLQLAPESIEESAFRFQKIFKNL
jgi:hypothetical protein